MRDLGRHRQWLCAIRIPVEKADTECLKCFCASPAHFVAPDASGVILNEWNFLLESTNWNLKADSEIRPVYPSKESRIEAHIFVPFLRCCVHGTLEVKMRQIAPGLTARAALAVMGGKPRVDVHFPTTDGRELIFRRPGDLVTRESL